MIAQCPRKGSACPRKCSTLVHSSLPLLETWTAEGRVTIKSENIVPPSAVAAGRSDPLNPGASASVTT